jgi:glutamate dehydrogenase
MNQLSHDFRSKTRELTLAGHGENGAGKQPLGALIDAWLAALEEEDFAGMTPDILASVLWQGFSRVVTRERPGCQVEVLRCQDGRGGFATALLIVNPDMPFLVDSIVMALRRLRIASRAVLNAVLSVTRGADAVR